LVISSETTQSFPENPPADAETENAKPVQQPARCQPVPVTMLRIGQGLGPRATLPNLKFAKLCRGITSQLTLKPAKIETPKTRASLVTAAQWTLVQ